MKKIKYKGYDYKFTSRIKNIKKYIKEEIFNKESYQDTDGISYKIIDYVNKINKTYELPKNLIITYPSQRAQKDRADRERLIKKDEMFDGYYGIETSEKNLTAKEILKAGENP